MDGLNYHHLLYFWKVAKRGSIAKASAELELTQPTISEQIRLLESSLGQKLFNRVGRSLVLTEAGQSVLVYAEKIFALGSELTEALSGIEPRPLVLHVGIETGLGQKVVAKLLAPALRIEPRPYFDVRRDSMENLLSLLSAGKVDVVLTAGKPPRNETASHAHLLLDCGTLFVVGKKRRITTAKFPRSLDGIPFLLPPAPLSAKLQDWFRRQKISPQIAGSFDSEDLMRGLAALGLGAFAAPDLKEREVPELKVLGRTDDVRTRFYALTRERRPSDPAIAAILESASRKPI
jgi:LysR family transcriptional activator of nhaA